MLEFSPHMTS